jgi:hypothetical protein
MAGFCARKMGALLLCLLAISDGAQSAEESFRVVNRTLVREPAGAVRLDGAPGDGVAWLQDEVFTTGRISVETQGADLEGRSFVGIAFHRANDQTFEVVYLRPFNFNSPDPARRAHSVQYVAMPAYPWQLLRQNHPGKYEAALPSTLPADSWVRLTLTIDARDVRVFVNDSAEPVLSIARLLPNVSGEVGLWVGNESAGRFRNLVIQP